MKRALRSATTLGDGRIAMLDSQDHRLVVVDAADTVTFIGGIGQSSTDFFRPLAMARAGDRLAVLDQDGGRLKVLGLPDFQLTESYVVRTVTDSVALVGGIPYLNSPWDGAVAVRIAPDGQIVQTIGELVNVKDVFPDKDNSESLRGPLSRAWLVGASPEKVVAAFQFLPLVRMFGTNGVLLWQRVLRAADGRPVLEATFWNEPGAQVARAVKKIDGIQFPLITRSAALDKQGRVWIATADGAVHVLDGGSGEYVTTVNLRETPFGGVASALDLTDGENVVACSSTACYSAPMSTVLEPGSAGLRPASPRQSKIERR